MAVVNKVICDICKDEIVKSELSFSVVGNVNMIDKNMPHGLDGGLFGGGQWLDADLSNCSAIDDVVPVHHFHVDCMKNHLEQQKTKIRG